MSKALDDFEVDGIGHNLPFLSAVMEHERFRSGKITTAFIAEEFPDGFSGVHPDQAAAKKLAAIAVFVNQTLRERAVQISGRIGGPSPVVGKDWVVTLAGYEEAVTLDSSPNGSVAVFADGTSQSLTGDWHPGQSHARFQLGDEAMGVKINLVASAIRLRWRGMDVMAQVRSPRVAALARLMPVKLPPDTSKMLLCPMPGVITSVSVKAGDQVEAGQVLATVEAMKMENVLKAERKGLVRRVAASAGQSLAVDELIMEFE
jgi:propionyl-CoA carboxylase alpha chain